MSETNLVNDDLTNSSSTTAAPAVGHDSMEVMINSGSSLSPAQGDYVNTSLSSPSCDSPESQSMTTSTATNDLNSLQQPSSPSLTEHSESDEINSKHHSIEPDDASTTSSRRSSSHVTITSSAMLFNQKNIDPDLCELLQRKQPKVVPHAPKCAACNKSVYKAEEIRAANKTYHKLCFKCSTCKKLLQTNILTEHQGDLFCRSCYSKNFGPKGYGFGIGALTTETTNINSSHSLQHTSSSSSPSSSSSSARQSSNPANEVVNNRPTSTLRSTFSTYNAVGSTPSSVTLNSDESKHENHDETSTTSLMTSSIFRPLSERKISTASLNTYTFGGSDKCGRCNKPVYAAEKISAAGKPYHKLCFACTSCKKLLNSMNCCNNSENDVFCKSCYGKFYGPKGVGFGIGAGALQTN